MLKQLTGGRPSGRSAKKGKDMATITVQAKYLRGIAEFVSKDEMRYNLTGVNIVSDPKKKTVTIQATDGHMVGRLVLPVQLGEDVALDLIVRFTPEQLKALRDSKEGLAVLIHEVDNAELYLVNTGTRMKLDIIDMAFPNVSQVIPDKKRWKPVDNILFDLNLFVVFQKAQRIMVGVTKNKTCCAKFTYTGTKFK